MTCTPLLNLFLGQSKRESAGEIDEKNEMLIAENITLESRKTALLAARELRVESGSAALLIGDNNSGKSLLLQAINNRYPYQGVIQIHTSTPLLNKLYRRRSKTIFLEHTANCIELDTVWRNILLPMEKLSSRQEQKVKEFCEMAKFLSPAPPASPGCLCLR